VIIQLAYVSTAARVMQREDLVQLLERAREINAGKDITGLLLYQGGHFMQVLEGNPDQVRPLFAHIAHDPRHYRISVLFDQEISQRQYADWSMGFQALDGSEWLEFPGLGEGFDDMRTVVEQYGRAKELLRLMRTHGFSQEKELATR
jgi:hypothetical protein